ncbi:hypothetical protein NBRC116590_02690 [Pelagimonas sp. KU-00592-HH]|uniref:DUF2460 domain-containing protein n=1 Tax=Pelagimonas sp. KU-00592-HH TaxID=3127651 RepID=UPI003103102C
MTYGACHEIRLSNAVLFGARSMSEFGVRITPLASGDEDREEVHSQSRRRLQITPGVESDEVNSAFREFVEARGGHASPFVVRDHTEYEAPEKTLWYDLEDVHSDDWTAYTVDGKIEFPLFRGYESGGHRRYRRITKPDSKGFRIWWNDDEITSGVEIDYGRGVVVFSYIPRSGRLYFAGTYNLCVRFDGEFGFAAASQYATDVETFELVELIGEEDYAPSSENDEYRAALGRTDDELSALIENFKELVN